MLIRLEKLFQKVSPRRSAIFFVVIFVFVIEMSFGGGFFFFFVFMVIFQIKSQTVFYLEEFFSLLI